MIPSCCNINQLPAVLSKSSPHSPHAPYARTGPQAAKHAEAVLAAMNDNVLIKGRKVNVEKANVSAKPARKSKSKPDTRRRKDESRGKHDKLKERRGKSGKVRRNGEKY